MDKKHKEGAGLLSRIPGINSKSKPIQYICWGVTIFLALLMIALVLSISYKQGYETGYVYGHKQGYDAGYSELAKKYGKPNVEIVFASTKEEFGYPDYPPVKGNYANVTMWLINSVQVNAKNVKITYNFYDQDDKPQKAYPDSTTIDTLECCKVMAKTIFVDTEMEDVRLKADIKVQVGDDIKEYHYNWEI